MWIRKRSDHSVENLFKRTISAQLHLLAALISVPAGWYLIVRVAPQGLDQAFLVSVYALFSTFVFAASGFYHLIGDGFERGELIDTWLDRADHSAIFFMIAGGYTAVIPKVLEPERVNGFLIVVWLFVLIGIIYIFFREKLGPVFGGRSAAAVIYVAFGSIGLAFAPTFLEALSSRELFLFVAGAATYVGGAVIYYSERFRSSKRPFDLHEVWHIAVIVGYSLHYLLIDSLYLGEAL